MTFVLTGNVFDALELHNGFQWSTYDRGPNSNCATSGKGGWWYARCYHSNLNGILLKDGETESSTYCRWHTIKDLTFVEMKVK